MDNKLLLEIATLIVIILVARGIYKTEQKHSWSASP